MCVYIPLKYNTGQGIFNMQKLFAFTTAVNHDYLLPAISVW